MGGSSAASSWAATLGTAPPPRRPWGTACRRTWRSFSRAASRSTAWTCRIWPRWRPCWRTWSTRKPTCAWLQPTARSICRSENRWICSSPRRCSRPTWPASCWARTCSTCSRRTSAPSCPRCRSSIRPGQRRRPSCRMCDTRWRPLQTSRSRPSQRWWRQWGSAMASGRATNVPTSRKSCCRVRSIPTPGGFASATSTARPCMEASGSSAKASPTCGSWELLTSRTPRSSASSCPTTSWDLRIASPLLATTRCAASMSVMLICGASKTSSSPIRPRRRPSWRR
mmetsp:Transcript_25449/g.60692  ORF Transcript_25449/g.60692 Transcript_25449/m.60692 type:complete len:283 (+) Transcript_25449:362-1210(+)